MNTKVAIKFALKNIKANRIILVPFILSSGAMLSLFYIMSSLLQNKFVQARHTSLPIIITIGAVIVGLFTYIFVVYANRFLIKRRNKEFALYGILGLEKRHIRRIIFLEQLISFVIISALSITGGYIFGKLIFLFLNNIIGDVSAKISDYPFSVAACGITGIFIVFIFMTVFFVSVINIKGTSPMELISKQYKGEGEPKSKIIIAIAGFILLGAGYIIAFVADGMLKSLGLFFVAAILVIFGTYFLFMSFSIIVLKLLKKNKDSYYKDKNFISISGMLYRMKANAVGLSSISVLCAGVIITTSATMAIYGSLENTIESSMSRAYEITSQEYLGSDIKKIEQESIRLEKAVNSSLKGDENINNYYSKYSMFTYVEKHDDEVIFPAVMGKGDNNSDKSILRCYLLVMTLDSYNSIYGKSLKLKEGEILLTSNSKVMLKDTNIKFLGKRLKINIIDDIVPKNLAIEAYMVIVPKLDDLVKFSQYYHERSNKDLSKHRPATIYVSSGWNISNEKKDYESRLKKLISNDMDLSTRKAFKKNIYDLNGGFLFLGIVIAAIFLIGTILITYYKQISEGFEDRHNYQIMKKVGLPDALIHQTSSSQIVWMFFLPLIASCVHSLVASKIVYQLLGLFGVRNYYNFGVKIGIVILVFAVVYFVIYKITSNVYYKIVSQ
ncbi:FtsX-like permease family protein [Peptostreptococcus sp. D1]|uniref:FtsX-like permease family protein n=1 Tax=Peptostreptococcus sp. D1 TaxID=72304 RepID=UPI0008DEACB7|nr:ABC transporter permease [Peptostreptococcus sp. D1]SFE55130.1 putative ABC transport system permease protein [Peptostreptococcus sp. D1]